MSIYIIAEAGVNHNGSLETAYEMARTAKRVGADCIKFQTFVAENLVSSSAKKANYQALRTGRDESQYEMLKKLELSFDDFRHLKTYCEQIGICFLSTPFDLESIAFLHALGTPFWKIPSGEVTDYPYLRLIGQTREPVVMSTGMCELNEIQAAMDTLRQSGTTSITLLHCNSAYPTPPEDVNLLVMKTLRECFHVNVGFSDHTQGIEIPIAAAAMGAAMIEKHFTLDCAQAGPDHMASLEPEAFAEMVRGIRKVEKALGDGRKTMTRSEQENRAVARKSIVAACTIAQGDVFTNENLTTKRSGAGLSPMRWNEVIGKKAPQSFEKDENICL